MRRTDREITDPRELESILDRHEVARVAFCDGEQPYLIPMNFARTERDGENILYFHCALEGRKLDMIRANPRVCFEVSYQGAEPLPHGGDPCDTPFESVICWGTARIVEDLSERQAILDEFQMRFEKPGGPREPVPLARVEGCGAVEITVSRMTGRRGLGHRPEHWEWVA